MRKTSKVSIEIYDADGELCESIGGPMDYEDVKEQMIDILRNDGIPVIRRHGKHEKAETGKVKGQHVIRAAMQDHNGDLKSALLNIKPTPALPPVPKFEPLLQLRWEYKGVKFDAIGKYDDVMDAQAELLRTILEE